MHGIFSRSLVNERNNKCVLPLLILNREERVAVANLDIEEADVVVLAPTPRETTDGAEGLLGHDGSVYVLVVGAVDKHLAMNEKLQFFGYLLRASEEILIVSLAYIGEDADGGLDDLAEMVHLARLRDSGFENGQLVVGSQLPDREGNTNLGVVATG